jgi:predicted permease
MIFDFERATRSLRRLPRYTAIIVGTLALAIGATTTIYSVVTGVLLTPLPFPDPDRLVILWQRAPGVGVDEDWFSPAQYFDIRAGVSSFEAVAITFGRSMTLSSEETEPERIGVLNVSSSFFKVLGISPQHGRLFTPEDDAPGTAQKVLIGQRLFNQRFGGDPKIVGENLQLDGRSIEVVGVLPELPLDASLIPSLLIVPTYDLVMSFPLQDPETTRHGSENFNVIARIAPGAARSQVEGELLAVAGELVKDPGSLSAGLVPGTEFHIGMVPLLDQVVGLARPALLLLLGATFLLLGVACANVANLLLTRAATRRRELAMRVALGASRARMMRDSMIESLTLSGMGGLAGLFLALVAISTLRWLAPDELPRLNEVGVNAGVLLFTIEISVASSLLFGLGPALRISRLAPIDALHETAEPVRAGSPWRRGGSRYLVIIQVALSLVLAVSTGLLVRTFWHLQTVDPGFQTEGVLTFRISLTGPSYQDRQMRRRVLEEARRRIAGLPDVAACGGSALLPMTDYYAWTDFIVEGYNASSEKDRIVADEQMVTQGYLKAMGIPMLAGRPFTDADGADPPVALVDRTMAERFWGVDEAVGKWVAHGPDDRATIVGVVESVKHYGLDAEPRMTVFYPYEVLPYGNVYFAVKTVPATAEEDFKPIAIAPSVIDIVRDLDPNLPVYDIYTMSDLVGNSLARQRVMMWLLNLFSGIALLVATVGLYGVLSFTVATHTHEIGIRKALGARRIDLYRLVMAGAAVVTGIGIGIGVLLTLLAVNQLEGLVYLEGLVHGITSTDPVSFFAGTAVVAVVALLASLLPARRAAKVDAMVALKTD